MISEELTSMSIQVALQPTLLLMLLVWKNCSSFHASVKFEWQIPFGKHVLHLSAVPELHLYIILK